MNLNDLKKYVGKLYATPVMTNGDLIELNGVDKAIEFFTKIEGIEAQIQACNDRMRNASQDSTGAAFENYIREEELKAHYQKLLEDEWNRL